jgi:hypothetical protein
MHCLKTLKLTFTLSLMLLLLFASGCAKLVVEQSLPPDAPLTAAKLVAGSVSLDAAAIGSGTNKGSISISTKTLSYSGVGMVRFNQGFAKIQSVPLGHFDAATDFGLNGSITLVADTVNYPISGGAYPVLVGFSVVRDSDGSTLEFVNITSGCTTKGMWVCTNGSCSAEPTCSVQVPSGFANRTDWDQHQVPPYGYTSTNSFPRCDSSVNGWSSCPSNLSTLPSGTYTAKYLLMSDSGNSVDSKTAGLRVSVSVKKDTQARNSGGGSNGGINLNLILVGDQNCNDSHSSKGRVNLNLLLGEINRLLSVESGASLGINQVQVYEWTDANGGSRYSQVDYSLLGDLFESGSKGLPASDEGNFINVFIVSDIQYSGSNFTILGLSGGILGPPKNGTQSSGLAFSSSDRLGSFNPSCNAVNCGRGKLENDFLEMAATIVHELGHYLGLNHPAESPDSLGYQAVDQLSDTPTCAYRTDAGKKYFDQRACYFSDLTVQPAPLANTTCKSACNAITGGISYLSATKTSRVIDPWTTYANSDMPAAFCPHVSECQQNHVMWYTTKNRRLLNGASTCSFSDAVNGLCSWSEDGNLFSAQSSAIIQWDSFLR